MKSSYYIGFANKYYTLWSIESDYNYSQNEYGQVSVTGITTRYSYFGHLSFDLDKAKVKVIEKGIVIAGVDMSLKGQSSWDIKEKTFCQIPASDLGFFAFGKFENQIISQCTDINYLEWYFGETSNKFAKQVLIANGYAMLNGYVVKQEIADRVDAITNQIAQITASGELTFVADKNLSGNGCIDVNGIRIQFNDYKQLSYNGFTYALPTIKKVGKKIKSKTIKCIVKPLVNDMNGAEFEVVSFELVQE